MEGKRASLAIVCVALLAILAVAGTVAYLQGASGDVVNTFSTNKVEVGLTEDSGQNYNIIPGTEQTKDPKVTVDNTVDAYAYVKVDDKTEGLVTYKIDDGWTALGGYPGVYYREVAANDGVKSFSVLEGDKVSYSASLTNEDMENLNELGTLTFTAYAIQKEPFNDPVLAYKIEDATTVDTADALKSTLENGGSVVLGNDVSYPIVDSTDNDGLEPVVTIAQGVNSVIDLNGNTIALTPESDSVSLTQTPVIASVDGGSLSIVGDGVVDAEAGNNGAYCINVRNGGELVIEGGTYYGAMTCVQVQEGKAIIRGGFFDLASTIKGEAPQFSRYLINCIDSAWEDGTAQIEITGGTFVNFNPAKTSSENPEANWVPDGYHVDSHKQSNGETWYTVVKDS